ncbi:SDR family oxidoreductase [Spirochaeta cellobiosiphila]|uniref:SDR family oxidoreductase n=1 Tax=Spirochaeta cellobiosiphila TaxID=504483 RepID=UPI00040BA07F|nr:SDR family oxidoreductase [Spirochaeta cellobiosiphila]
MTYAITGSTGQLGNFVIKHLLEAGIKPESILPLARSEEKAKTLKELGLTPQYGSYEDKASLVKAFTGADKLLLISSSEVGKRTDQHKNAINAAKEAGVKQVIYTSITDADNSTSFLAPEHKATEQALKESGLDYVLLRNNWYIENFLQDAQQALETGQLISASNGQSFSPATRSDYAKAAVKVLTTEGHSKKIYELTGLNMTYQDMAVSLSKIGNKDIKSVDISLEDMNEGLKKAGLDDNTIWFVMEIQKTINAGNLSPYSKDLETLIGSTPTSFEEGIKTFL